eukprot:TRINITY_DN65643_c0_g1_i1.p1 TRINITY_DN65643_c0_g1~~TRINITY_DN65643_c0_g1_i1.p1  ORF type:complete len:126 (-),score=4.56 TRINITY_DN65643_c0_g1_i1:1786-2163(-)
MTEEILWKELTDRGVKDIQRIKLPRDRHSRCLKGYAFVGFESREIAIQVKQKINYEQLFENRIHVSIIGYRPEDANLLIKNIDTKIDPKDFDNFFTKWGTVLSSKLALTPNGLCQGYGYVQFENK